MTETVNVRTWANGFGTWHASVSKNADSPEMVAQAHIMAELLERKDIPRGLVPPVALVEKAETHWVYREDWQD